ncbi:hypothetical protein [Palleronia sp. THAF1]|uniref:hypothetical protein n=1 Tax=Palleronia sp. THAF1 TaxID=2587842 RepID=UPI0015620BCB|nr:hypothetical protein [Palleronia sp. THAF1]
MGFETQIYHCFVNWGAAGAATGFGTAQPRDVLHLVELSKTAATGAAAARAKAK